MCKIWVKVVKPYSSAIISLNKQLFDKSKTIEYIFDRPIVKNIIFPAAQSSLVVEMPFMNSVPNKLLIFLVKQTSLNGDYKTNSFFLPHCNISNIKVDISGVTVSDISTNFPDSVASGLYRTVGVLGSKNLLTYSNFQKGRTIFALDFRSSDNSDSLHVEKQGPLRVSISTSTPLTENHILFMVGLTTGVIEIDSHKNVYKSFAM